MSDNKKRKKRMRLPNGIGSVHLINDGKRRRKPWRARVPAHVEFNAETGKASQKYINIGYYETETEAIEALFDYRKNPYTIEASVATFAEVYQMWSAKKFPTVSKMAQYGYAGAYNHSETLHNMKMRDIRTTHLEGVMQALNGGHQLQSKLRTLWGQMFKFAMERDIVQKNYASFVALKDKEPETKRTAIAKEDIKTFWKEADKDNRMAKIALVYIYTGMRATELLETTKANVDLNKRIIVAGKKTEAGKDRRIPIHKDIMPFIEEWMQEDGETLLTEKGKRLSYSNFKTFRWIPFMKELKMDYTIHYARHTFATLMREAEIADDIRKLIIGHKNDDITNRYTHHSDEMLIEAIDRLKGRE